MLKRVEVQRHAAALSAAAALFTLSFAWTAPAAAQGNETYTSRSTTGTVSNPAEVDSGSSPRPVPAVDRRAHLDYMLHCQGCHMPDGAGVKGVVPALSNQVGQFLATPDGRAYLVQVPGASQALIDDAALARLTNWMVRRFDPENAKDFQAYDALEVGRLRSSPITNPVAVRRRIMAELPRPPRDEARQKRH